MWTPLPQRVSFRCFDRPEIDTYRSQFKSLFPNKDMKEELPQWFGSQIRQCHVDNDKDPEVSTTSELFALACGPTWTPISINSCVVDGVRYIVHSRNERRTTQNSGICSPGPDGEMYYGQLQEILEFKYLLFKVVLFRVKWFDTRNQGHKVKCLVLRNNMTQIYCREDDPDIINFDNSSDLLLSTSLNDLDNATLHIDGQSTKVDALPDIIDVVDEEDDIIDDEDTLLHDLADSDDEDLINVDDDGVDKMSADVARSHGGDGGDEDRPPLYNVPTGCGGCFANRGKGKRKPNLGDRAAGRLHTRDKTQNLSLKEITDKKGPVPIRFEVRDKQTLMPLGDHAAHWSSYIGEVIRGVPLYYPSWLKVPKERKAALITDIGTQFDLRPHMESPDWTVIEAGIQQHLQKAYNTNKAAFKAQHWVIDTETGSYNVEKIRRARPEEEVTTAEGRPQTLRSTLHSLTPSGEHTLLTGYSLRDEDRRIYEEMKRLEATGEYTEDEINALARRMVKLVGHSVWFGIAITGTSRPSMSAPTSPLKSMLESLPKDSPATCRWGNVCHRGTNCLTEKRVGPTSSLGIIAGDCIPDEDSPATFRWG
ncbi:hypothetical protein Tco_0538022 [Tanacetum coccineum]